MVLTQAAAGQNRPRGARGDTSRGAHGHGRARPTNPSSSGPGHGHGDARGQALPLVPRCWSAPRSVQPKSAPPPHAEALDALSDPKPAGPTSRPRTHKLFPSLFGTPRAPIKDALSRERNTRVSRTPRDPSTRPLTAGATESAPHGIEELSVAPTTGPGQGKGSGEGSAGAEWSERPKPGSRSTPRRAELVTSFPSPLGSYKRPLRPLLSSLLSAPPTLLSPLLSLSLCSLPICGPRDFEAAGQKICAKLRRGTEAPGPGGGEEWTATEGEAAAAAPQEAS